MNKKRKIFLVIILILLILGIGLGLGLFLFNTNNENGNVDKVKILKLDNMITGTWQAEVKFPDWKGYIYDTLAMNSMYSFDGVKDQGKLYFTIGNEVESFDLFINNNKINTDNMKNGIYEVDISKIALNGTNTIQVSNIVSFNANDDVIVNIPYPRVIDGTLKEVRFK